MSRSTIHFIVESVLATSVISAFVLTTVANAQSAPLNSTGSNSSRQREVISALTPASAVGRLPVPINPSPSTLFQRCIGTNAKTLCPTGGTPDESVIVKPASIYGDSLIRGNITVFSGQTMDPHALGRKFNLFAIP